MKYCTAGTEGWVIAGWRIRVAFGYNSGKKWRACASRVRVGAMHTPSQATVRPAVVIKVAATVYTLYVRYGRWRQWCDQHI